MLTRLTVALFLISILSACSDAEHANNNTTPTTTTPDVCEPRPEPSALIDNMVWVPLGADADPFLDHRPATVTCDAGRGSLLEGSVLEIDTAFCNMFTASQPLRVDVQHCETIQLVISHEPLFDEASTGAVQAHLAVIIGDALLWEEYVPIPSPSGLLVRSIQVPMNVPAGTPVVFHLHNHGLNTWNLISMNRSAR